MEFIYPFGVDGYCFKCLEFIEEDYDAYWVVLLFELCDGLNSLQTNLFEFDVIVGRGSCVEFGLLHSNLK